MHTVHVLIFADLPGGMEPHEDDGIRVVLHRADAGLQSAQFAEPLWAFVDWNLPELPGLEICRRLRCNPQTAHARIVMALDEASAKNRRCASQAGASEYMAGPVTRDLVLGRVLADRPRPADRAALRLNALTIDFAACQARWRDKPLHLMPIQLRLLQFLVEHPGQIFTRKQLMEALGNLETRMEERTVDVWIGRLRRSLKEAGGGNLLRTVRSLGYMLVPPG